MKNKTSIYFQVFVACLSLFALGWMDNARGPFFPLFLEETGETAARGAMFFALASFVAIVSSALAGPFIKVFGLKTLLIFSGLCMAASPVGLVLMPNITGALVTAFVFGTSLGAVAVGQNVLIGVLPDESLKRRLFSLLHCFYALAAMTAPLSVVYLKAFLPWNYVLCVVSFLALSFVCLVPFLKSSNLKQGSTSSIDVPAPSFADFKLQVWIVFMSFYVASELILSTRLVLWATSAGAAFEKASLYLFLFFLFMFVARFALFLFKLKLKTYSILIFCILGAFICFGLGQLVHPLFMPVIGGFVGPIFPVVMDRASKDWPEHFDLIVSRLIAASSIFVVAAHMSVGKLTDWYGIEKSIYAIGVFLAFAGVTLAFAHFKKLIE